MLKWAIMEIWGVVATFLLFAMLIAAFLCLFYAWAQWPRELRFVGLIAWRRAAVSVAILTVTMQAILFVALWTPVGRHHVLLRKCMSADFVLMLLAIPCIFTWRGSARWCLLASAVFLPVLCFFTALAELAY